MSEKQNSETVAFQREKSTGMLVGRNVFGDATPQLDAFRLAVQPEGQEGESEAPLSEIQEGDI